MCRCLCPALFGDRHRRRPLLVRPFPILSRLIWAVALALTLSASPRAAMAQDAALSAELWAEAEAFRFTAATDFLFALDASSTPDANLKFAELAALDHPAGSDLDTRLLLEFLDDPTARDTAAATLGRSDWRSGQCCRRSASGCWTALRHAGASERSRPRSRRRSPG